MVDVTDLLAETNEQIMDPDNKERLRGLLRTYERVLEIDPANYEALWSLGRYNVVMVLGYTESRSEKEKHNLAAINYCEQAMNTNPEFKALSAGGSERVGDACRVLTRREIAPLFIGMPEWDRTGRSICLSRKEYATCILLAHPRKS